MSLMPKLNKLAATLIASLLIAAPALAADAQNFVTVNGFAVPQKFADSFVAEQLAQGAQDSPEFRDAIKNELTRRALILSEVKKQGVDKRPEVRTQVEIASQLIQIRAFILHYLRTNPVTDAEIQQSYNDLVAQLGSTEYKVSHILVASEEEAKDIIVKLGKGEAFAELAKASQDPGSKENGGDLGWSTPTSFVQPFGEALKQLEKGKYSAEPVQTDFGYHVILLEDTRELPPPPLDQLKPQLTQRAEQQKVEKMINDLLAKAKIR
jgi:peptidyl-prolyl cis-trans isomerase C